MGKALIIEGANFASVAVDTIDLSGWTTLKTAGYSMNAGVDSAGRIPRVTGEVPAGAKLKIATDNLSSNIGRLSIGSSASTESSGANITNWHQTGNTEPADQSNVLTITSGSQCVGFRMFKTNATYYSFTNASDLAAIKNTFGLPETATINDVYDAIMERTYILSE